MANNNQKPLTIEILLIKARECVDFFEKCLKHKPDWKWARKGVWYSRHFEKILSRPINPDQALRLGKTAQQRFRCSHPPFLQDLGKALVNYVNEISHQTFQNNE